MSIFTIYFREKIGWMNTEKHIIKNKVQTIFLTMWLKKGKHKKPIKTKLNFLILDYLVQRFEFFLANAELGVSALPKS